MIFFFQKISFFFYKKKIYKEVYLFNNIKGKSGFKLKHLVDCEIGYIIEEFFSKNLIAVTKEIESLILTPFSQFFFKVLYSTLDKEFIEGKEEEKSEDPKNIIEKNSINFQDFCFELANSEIFITSFLSFRVIFDFREEKLQKIKEEEEKKKAEVLNRFVSFFTNFGGNNDEKSKEEEKVSEGKLIEENKRKKRQENLGRIKKYFMDNQIIQWNKLCEIINTKNSLISFHLRPTKEEFNDIEDDYLLQQIRLFSLENLSKILKNSLNIKVPIGEFMKLWKKEKKKKKFIENLANFLYKFYKFRSIKNGFIDIDEVDENLIIFPHFFKDFCPSFLVFRFFLDGILEKIYKKILFYKIRIIGKSIFFIRILKKLIILKKFFGKFGQKTIDKAEVFNEIYSFSLIVKSTLIIQKYFKIGKINRVFKILMKNFSIIEKKWKNIVLFKKKTAFTMIHNYYLKENIKKIMNSILKTVVLKKLKNAINSVIFLNRFKKFYGFFYRIHKIRILFIKVQSFENFKEFSKKVRKD